MLSDSTAIALGLFATLLSKRKANRQYNYGFGRVETLAGFVNGVGLLIASVKVGFEGLGRLLYPVELKGDIVWVGVVGLIVNLVGVFAFGHDHSDGGLSHLHEMKEHSHSESDSHSHSNSHGHSTLMVIIKNPQINI